jgi:nucleoside-triphosphatase THEP1
MQGARMLGFVTITEHGAGDRLLWSVADTLRGQGWRLAGAVQINSETGAGRARDMELLVLTGDRKLRISQNLGAFSQGCRLDPDALETAVGLVDRALEAGADLVIVNKFGKQEVGGRGFRPLIGRALSGGVPVLTMVGAAKRAEFDAFAGGMAHELPARLDALLDWCRAIRPAAAGAAP